MSFGQINVYRWWLAVLRRDAVCIAVAGILLLAAALKGYLLATRPSLEADVFYEARAFQIGLVNAELLLGCWLLSNVGRVWARWVAMLVFAAFGWMSFYKGISGASTCGCFGAVEMNPWVVFGMDLLIVAALFFGASSAAEARSSGRR